MAFLNLNNVEIKGISACVPKITEKISDIYIWEGAEEFVRNTGIQERRISSHETTSADLCYEAANKLIEELNWNREEIQALVFVSQTPDFILPTTACLLQNRLGLNIECFTLDISLGCSGWVYALSVIASLMQTGQIKKALLLAGDTILKYCSPKDKSTFPLFGDAGTATALEFKDDIGKSQFSFNFNSDGSGENVIKINDGGCRNPISPDSFTYEKKAENIYRRKIDLILEGMDVFSFGISKVPKSITELCDHFHINLEETDVITLHQANKMMNERIRKKLKLPEDKVPYSLDFFANTSCASIPLTLVVKERARLQTEKLSHICCGFGVGLSWASVYFTTEKIKVPQLIEI